MIVHWISIRKNRAGKLESETLRKQEMTSGKVIREIIRTMEVLKYDRLERQDNAILLIKSDPKKEGAHFIVAIGGITEDIDSVMSDPRVKKYITKAP